MKKFIVTFTISLLTGMLFVAFFVYLQDPFYHYHEPVFSQEAYMDNALYQTPGAARNFKYDAAIVGSSMTENFRESWFKEMGLNMQKLSYSGAEFKDYDTIYSEVFSSGNEVRFILTDINEFQLLSAVDAVYHEYPDYLYDRMPLTDVKYLFNNDVFWDAAGRLVERIGINGLKKDDSYTWEEAELFSEERARADFDMFKEKLEFSAGETADESDEEKLLLEDNNMELLVKTVREHPDTTFVFYYPPYSTLFWDEIVMEDNLDVTLKLYERSMTKLLRYDNVLVFDFQDDEELITDLSRYRDVCHHDLQGNRYIFECIRDTVGKSGQHNGEFLVTADNLQQHMENLKRIIEVTKQ